MLKRIKAYILGIKDGMNPPFSMGMTYSNPRLNESYDAGVNMGEVIHTICQIKKHPKSFLP